MECIEIIDTQKQLAVKNARIDAAAFENVSLAGATFMDVNMANIKISDANLSGIEIMNAQMGGAYLHDIGMPPTGHPMYDTYAKQKPLRFEDCNLTGTTINDCNLTAVEITACDITGLKIDGILIAELIMAYKQRNE